jgi:hypothetical protein
VNSVVHDGGKEGDLEKKWEGDDCRVKWRSFKHVPYESKEGRDEIEMLSLEGSRKRYHQDEDEM